MLTDFGLATFDGDGGLTQPGVLLGSPQYVAPERIGDGLSTVEGDLWSLGASLYAAVEGRSPYARSSPISTLAALATEPPDPTTKAGPLTPVISGLLRRDPRERLTGAEGDRMLRRVLAEPDDPAEAETENPAKAEPGPAPEPGPARRGWRDRRIVLPAVAALLLLVALGVTVTRGWIGGPEARSLPGGSSARSGPDGPPVVGPPSFGCRTPPPPVDRVAPTTTPPGRPALAVGWTWHTDRAGFRIPAPVDWEYFRGEGVLCFHEPSGPRVLIVDPAPASIDADVYWQEREERLTGDDRVVDYELVAARTLAGRTGNEWEFRWTGTDGQLLHSSEMLLRTAPDRAFAIVWHTPDLDWRRNIHYLAAIRDGFEATVPGAAGDPGDAGGPAASDPRADPAKPATSVDPAGPPPDATTTDATPQPGPPSKVPPGLGGRPPGLSRTPPGLGGEPPGRGP